MIFEWFDNLIATVHIWWFLDWSNKTAWLGLAKHQHSVIKCHSCHWPYVTSHYIRRITHLCYIHEKKSLLILGHKQDANLCHPRENPESDPRTQGLIWLFILLLLQGETLEGNLRHQTLKRRATGQAAVFDVLGKRAKERKGPLWGQRQVCLFLATEETCQCNMASSVGWGSTPSADITGSFKGNVNTLILGFNWLYTNEIIILNMILYLCH